MSAASAVHPLRVRDFRLLWIGESISLVGDQFYLVALPWVVLQITGSALMLGVILALMGIPRALFMLVGGALVDRFSPRRVMFAANLARMLIVSLLAVLVLSGQLQLWMLYLLAFAIGIADAFYFPAQSAIVPALLESDQLELGNTLIQSMMMMSIFLGPLIAGFVIGGDSSSDLRGSGLIFALDAASFLASLVTLWLIRWRGAAPAAAHPNVLRSIREGIGYVRSSVTLRSVLVLFIAIYLFVNGPFDLGAAVLAKNHLAEGAAALGILISAYGGGALIGVLVTSITPLPPALHFGTLILGISALSGIAMMLMPISRVTLVVAAVGLGIGFAMGYVEIQAIIWLQRRIPEHLMGRVMSLIAIASAAVAPLSSALAGAIADANTTRLFVGAGGLMTLTALALLAMRPVRQMGLEVVESRRKTTLAQALRTTREVAITPKRTTGSLPIVRP